MPKETENLEVAGEFMEQPELPAAETEEADGQTDAARGPVSESAEDPPLKHRRPRPRRNPCRPVKSRPLGPLFQNQIPRRRVPRQS